MKFKSVLLIIFLFFTAGLVRASHIPDQKKPLVIAGVTVEFVVNSQTFPPDWKTEEIAAKGVSLDASEVERSIEMVKKALAKYPAGVLSKNLKKIYILKSMEFFGVGFGGTNSTDVVYVTNDGAAKGYTDAYIEGTFHHEFSSILLRNYPEYLNENKWLSINQLEYGEGGVEAIRNETAGQDYDESLMEAGFLVQYATSDMENDFNVFAENLFCADTKFWEYCDKYPRINSKVGLMVDFYARLSSKFTREYFVSAARK